MTHRPIVSKTVRMVFSAGLAGMLVSGCLSSGTTEFESEEVPFGTSADSGNADAPVAAGGESPGALNEENAGQETLDGQGEQPIGEGPDEQPVEAGAEEPFEEGEEATGTEGEGGDETLGFCAQWTAVCGEWDGPRKHSDGACVGRGAFHWSCPFCVTLC